jgi:hypothetical protein
MDSDISGNDQAPTESNMQQVINYAIGRAIPTLIPVVDERVESILGTAVSAMEAAANRIETATRGGLRNPRRSNKKRSVTLGEYDGDTEATLVKSQGQKPTRINKQHVCFHYLIIFSIPK